MEKVYICLFPNTFIWKKRDRILVYNGITGTGFRVDYHPVKRVVDALLDFSTLYCVELEEAECTAQAITFFSDMVVRENAGRIVRQPEHQPKPVVIPPLLNLQSDITRLQRESSVLVSEHLLEYLQHLTIDLSVNMGTEEQSSRPDTDALSHFLLPAVQSGLSGITIRGVRPDNIRFVEYLSERLDFLPVKKIVCVKHGIIRRRLMEGSFLRKPGYRLEVEVDSFGAGRHVGSLAARLKNRGINACWKFLVHNSTDLAAIYDGEEEVPSGDTRITPMYTGGNIDFFEKEIFLTETDLLNAGLNRREVFAHQAINTNYFGRLTITANGQVYANPRFTALGCIQDDLSWIIHKELTQGESWLRIRSMKPCCHCLYQWLCPSPSDYELDIGRPNLCHITLR